jgi:hypothetical protein
LDTEVAGGRAHAKVPRPGAHTVPGILINTNTREAFVNQDKMQLLQQVTDADVLSRRAPTRLKKAASTVHGSALTVYNWPEYVPELLPAGRNTAME